uniref:Uncharacterized protein n=1 Tax=Phocoena sinus TaxID=42100 RepID=A0A8C9AVT3_PHOSS
PGRGCFALAILLAIVENKLGQVNYTVMGLKQHPKFGHSKGALSSGFLQEKVWMMLVTSLVALQAL